MTDLRTRQLRWLKAAQERTRMNRTRLARGAGVDPSTLSKFERGRTRHLDNDIVEKIAGFTGIPAYRDKAVDNYGGFSEGDAVPWSAPGEADELSRMVAEILGKASGRDPWRLNSRVLELAGYLPGDVLIVDLNASPRAGDVVCAQFYSGHDTAETLMRLYEPPVLVGATLDQRLIPPLLLGKDVAIRGVVIASLRPRRTGAPATLS